MLRLRPWLSLQNRDQPPANLSAAEANARKAAYDWLSCFPPGAHSTGIQSADALGRSLLSQHLQIMNLGCSCAKMRKLTFVCGFQMKKAPLEQHLAMLFLCTILYAPYRATSLKMSTLPWSICARGNTCTSVQELLRQRT